MFNFEHEVLGQKNRYLRYFIVADYFHDGVVHKINFLQEYEELELVISCEREWAADFQLQDGYTCDNPALEHKFDDKYMYKLHFTQSKYFHMEVNETGLEYLNGRFKDSAKLRSISQSDKRRLYNHLRIQLSGGYLDLVFSGFEINKKECEIRIPRRIEKTIPFSTVIQKFHKQSVSSIREAALTGDWFERYFAIQYLTYINDPELIDIALKGISGNDSEVALASVFALGKLGRHKVLPVLLDLWLREDHPMYKRHIQDAIEKVVAGEAHIT
jgi:hypothetical protein